MDFEDWTAGKRDRLEPQVTEWFYGPGSRVFQSYNTLDAVTRVGDTLDSGQCAICGGVRRPKQCRCGADHGGESNARTRSLVALDVPALDPAPEHVHEHAH